MTEPVQNFSAESGDLVERLRAPIYINQSYDPGKKYFDPLRVEAANEISRLRSVPLVRLLEWTERTDSADEVSYWADHQFGCYAVERDYFSVKPWELIAGGCVIGNFDSADAAQAAAQENFEERLRSCLLSSSYDPTIQPYDEPFKHVVSDAEQLRGMLAIERRISTERLQEVERLKSVLQVPSEQHDRSVSVAQRSGESAAALVHRFEMESMALHKTQREWLVREIGAAIASQPPAAPVETATKSAPEGSAPHNSGERLPSSDAADTGADTQCSAGNAGVRREALAKKLHDEALKGLAYFEQLTEPNKEIWYAKADAWIAADLKEKRAHNRKHPLPVTFEAGGGAGCGASVITPWAVDEPSADSGGQRRQYYYRMNGCNAAHSQAPDCVCWHDEGTGPYADRADAPVTWRTINEPQQVKVREALEAAKEWFDEEFSESCDLAHKNRVSKMCDKIDAALAVSRPVSR